MAPSRARPTRDHLLRWSWWVAAALLVLDVVVSPGVLGGPVSRFGGDDDGELALTIHWVAVALLAWMAVASYLRSGAHQHSSSLSSPYPTSMH